MTKLHVNPVPEKYQALFEAAGEEVGLPYAVQPDYARYHMMMDCGDCLFVGAEDDGVPVGYIVVLFIQDLFNRAILHAVVDSFYVVAEHRGTALPGRLLAKVMPTVKAVAHDLVFQCKGGTRLAASLESRGFRVIDLNYCKLTKEM